MHETYKKWLDDNCPKVYCNCPCHQEIIVKKHHSWYGIPKYIRGHNPFTQFQKGNQFGFKKGNQLRKGCHPSTEFKAGNQFEFKKGNQLRKGQKPINGFKKGHSISPNSGYGKGCYYDSPLQGKIWLRSSYELKFAEWLDKNNIDWLYEIQTFNLGNTTYTPDFYLPTCNMFIEIKGHMLEKAEEKINKFLDNYNEETLKILYKEDLVKLGVL